MILGEKGCYHGEIPRTADGGFDWTEWYEGGKGGREVTTQVELSEEQEALLAEARRTADRVERVVDAFLEALTPAFKVFAGQFRVFMARLRVLYVALQRMQLEVVLRRRWHVPNSIAYWLPLFCPERWLPELKPELWEWGKGEDEL